MVNFYNKIFVVLIFTSSTAGWSKGLILTNFPIIDVSSMKYENNSPKDCSSKSLISNSLYGIPFFFKDFIKEHPGGSDKIMLAAGKSIDEYWFLYPQHEKNDRI